MTTATMQETELTTEQSSKGGTLLVATGITKTFGEGDAAFQALKGIDISIRNGEFVSITGESGSGKSTLLSILGCISPPDKGTIEVDGIDLYALGVEQQADFRREYIGFVFQQFHLIPYLSAMENVSLPLSITGMSVTEMKERSMEALSRVGLADKARNLPSALSGGQQQRVAIARALVNYPPIILADEPTGNLDTKTGESVFKLFSDLNAQGETVILVTHNPELAARTSRGIILRDGHVEAEVQQ